MVVDPFSLEVLFRLSSRLNSDWISAFHVIRPRNRQDDVVLAITTTGAVKVCQLELYRVLKIRIREPRLLSRFSKSGLVNWFCRILFSSLTKPFAKKTQN